MRNLHGFLKTVGGRDFGRAATGGGFSDALYTCLSAADVKRRGVCVVHRYKVVDMQCSLHCRLPEVWYL